MQDSFLDFSKVFLVFLLVFGFLSLIFLFSQPKQGDDYSALYLLPKKITFELHFDYGQKAALRFDENNNCYKRLQDLNFSFGIKNNTSTDKNYLVNYFVTNNINLKKNFLPFGEETIFVAAGASSENEKQLFLSQTCISFPFFVVVAAREENKDYNVYFKVSSPDISSKPHSVLFFDENTTKPIIKINQDQNKALIIDSNTGCVSNYPALLFSFKLSNFEKTDANYTIRYYATQSPSRLDTNFLVLRENAFLQNNEIIFFDKNLLISKQCLKLPFFVVVDARALKTVLRKNFVINKVTVVTGD